MILKLYLVLRHHCASSVVKQAALQLRALDTTPLPTVPALNSSVEAIYLPNRSLAHSPNVIMRKQNRLFGCRSLFLRYLNHRAHLLLLCSIYRSCSRSLKEGAKHSLLPEVADKNFLPGRPHLLPPFLFQHVRPDNTVGSRYLSHRRRADVNPILSQSTFLLITLSQ